MRQRDYTRSQILEIVKADPRQTLRELCEAAHQTASNVMYHVRRLEKDGLVKLQARIDEVVKKALADPQAEIGEDATMQVLPNGIKVIVRKPSLWGSRAHVG